MPIFTLHLFIYKYFLECLQILSLNKIYLHIFYFSSVKVHHARATSYTVTRLQARTQYDMLSSRANVTMMQAGTQYEVFLVPFYKRVTGLPSVSVGVSTLEARPGSSPALTNVTSTTTSLFVAWRPLNPGQANGVLEGYR